MSTLPQSKRESCRRHNMKRTETMGKKPDQISVSLHRYQPLISLAAIQPHPPPPLPQFRYFSSAKYASRRPSTVQNYPPPPSPRSFAPQGSTSSSSSITILPSDGSITFPSLAQPRCYLASRTPGNPHADAHRALAFPWFAFLR